MENKTNGLAIAGFVVSISSLLFNPLAVVGLVGIVLSAIGKSQIKRDGTGGGKLATAGIVVGVISNVLISISLANIM